ncbi:MAG: molybdopterin-dependent oxidoreductase, partial [Thermoplasmata archaeon]
PTGTADWKGVKVSAILDLAEVKDNATEVVFYAADGYSSSLTLDYLMRDDVILAYEMNGEVLPRDHGYPLRLVAPNKYGYKWVKWITHMEVVGHDYEGYWESRGWSDDADIYFDWGPHSMVLTLSAYIGSLALVSGFRFSNRVEFGPKLPPMFSRKFHVGTSALYYMTMLGTSAYWALTAFQRKGAFPNVPHGYLALAVMVLAVTGIISGLLLKRIKGDNIRLFHFTVNVLGYLLILGTILTGLFVSGIIVR